MNSEWSTTICFPGVFREIRKTKRQTRIILHDTMRALSHRSVQITFLTGYNVELIGHPPYRLDLAFNNFHLFPHMKNGYVVNDFRLRKKRLIRSTLVFIRNEKSASKIGSNEFRSVLILMEQLLYIMY